MAEYTKFTKMPLRETPYIPIIVYVDRDFTDDIKNKLFIIIDKLLSAGYVVRVNGDDLAFYEKVKTLACDSLEIYIPWKGFNDIESKFYFNDQVMKNIAEANFPVWDKVPDAVKAILSRNVRMVLGEKNNSCGNYLVTWSPDGATAYQDIGVKSGRASFIMKLAAKFGIPIANIENSNSVSAFSNVYNL